MSLGPRHGGKPLRGLDPGSLQPGRFGRIFPRSSYAPSDTALHDLAERMREANSSYSGDNPNIPLGFVFLAQFVDHDLTLDATTQFGMSADPSATVDFRTPNFDLDSLYGAGPGVSRHMFSVTPPDDRSPVKLMLDSGREFDLPRNSQNTALIGDLRNDENFLISQLHLAFIKFHNQVVDQLRSSFNPTDLRANTELFHKAADTVRRHYQWILLHEFLPLIVGRAMVDDVLRHGPLFFDWKKLGARYPFMPVEFSTAAYRLGHTMLRKDYIINDMIKKDLFDLPSFGAPKIQSVLEKVDFKKFFDFPGAPSAQRARRFDTKITEPVFTLPFIDPRQDPPVSLIERNLRRSTVFGVPSGQEIAQAMRDTGIKLTIYSNQDLGIADIGGLNGQAPLFYYILKESEFAPSPSLHLGSVGGRIVAEVFIELLSTIEGNLLYPRQTSTWSPALPGAVPGQFTMVDLLTFAQA